MPYASIPAPARPKLLPIVADITRRSIDPLKATLCLFRHLAELGADLDAT
jgi:hypothetical protein